MHNSLKGQNFSLFNDRRKVLAQLVKEKYEVLNGKIILFANFERDGFAFKQDSSFYYYTGVTEPASALYIDLATDHAMLFVPNFGKERSKWISDAIVPNEEIAKKLCVDCIEYLGNPCLGYQCHPFFTHREYEHFLKLLEQWIAEGQKIFTLNPTNAREYIEQRFVLQRIGTMIPAFEKLVVDISLLVAQMRRKKSKYEIEQLYKAIEITINAHEAVMREMKAGMKENELQALIEYHYTIAHAIPAFSSIVASGPNSTILHYMENKRTLISGDLVVVDIGAQYNYYCADLTRTYPVTGKFTPRQQEVYNLVLETQSYIAQCAKPGMWLSNKNEPEQSLNHLAKKYLDEHGYGNYFPHGIGHFLGIDVHDVGDYSQRLEEGDVITIEPGIYIAGESLGVRIEDDYWIVKDGSLCLSENLPKSAKDIEEALK